MDYKIKRKLTEIKKQYDHHYKPLIFANLFLSNTINIIDAIINTIVGINIIHNAILKAIEYKTE